MQDYTTIAREGEFVYEEKKSVFIGLAFPVESEEAAIAHISAVRARYPDARHHVYAYSLREQNKTRYSDDHEPQGTAGMPVLNVITKNGCTDTLVVVTRYFGGTLLGTGGLVRAYTAAAVGAVEHASIITYREYCRFALRVSYADHSKLLPEIERVGLRVSDTEYADMVTVYAAIPVEEFEVFMKQVTEITAARVELLFRENCFDHD